MASRLQICRYAKIIGHYFPFRSCVIRYRPHILKKTSFVLLSSGVVGVASKKETILEVNNKIATRQVLVFIKMK